MSTKKIKQDNVKDVKLSRDNLKAINDKAWDERVSCSQTEPYIDISKYLTRRGFEILKAPLKSEISEDLTGIILVDESDKNNKIKVIAIQESLEKEKSRFIAAHEYGHYILHKKDLVQFGHRDYKELPKNVEEQEADAYARCFLMPEQLIIPIVNKKKQELKGKVNEKSEKSVLIKYVRETFEVTEKKARLRLNELYLI